MQWYLRKTRHNLQAEATVNDKKELIPKHCVPANNILGSPAPAIHEKLVTTIHGCDECQLGCPQNKQVLEKA